MDAAYAVSPICRVEPRDLGSRYEIGFSEMFKSIVPSTARTHQSFLRSEASQAGLSLVVGAETLRSPGVIISPHSTSDSSMLWKKAASALGSYNACAVDRPLQQALPQKILSGQALRLGLWIGGRRGDRRFAVSTCRTTGCRDEVSRCWRFLWEMTQ